ncbi:MAG TPA: hypothetical protein VET90_04925, partial [Candidatus Binatus sp.]|nr:hypothetical protein [Candidatus Binatus sp.]
MTLPSLVLVALAVFAVGGIVGALAFSLTVGRLRAARVAQLADRLAQITGDGPPREPIRYPDRALTQSLERLADRIAAVEGLA